MKREEGVGGKAGGAVWSGWVGRGAGWTAGRAGQRQERGGEWWDGRRWACGCGEREGGVGRRCGIGCGRTGCGGRGGKESRRGGHLLVWCVIGSERWGRLLGAKLSLARKRRAKGAVEMAVVVAFGAVRLQRREWGWGVGWGVGSGERGAGNGECGGELRGEGSRHGERGG